jgi:monoamine oxidase
MTEREVNTQGGVSRRRFLRDAGVVSAAGAAVAVGAAHIDGVQAQENNQGCKSAGCDYDVVVIGGGFAGVTAARDSSKHGYKTLLLEARNRLGGRTFSSEFAGHKIELGGTWIHWTQPFVWGEVERYGLQLKETPEHHVPGKDTLSVIHEGKRIELAGKDLMSAVEGIYAYFAEARKLWERPYDAKYTWNQLSAVDAMSATDRYAQLSLTPLQRTVVDAYIAGISHTTSDKASYADVLRWWSLPGWELSQFSDSLGRYTFKNGTISLINAMIADGQPEVRLSTPVAKVEDKGDRVPITTQPGDTIVAGAVIVAVPMNVLPRIAFSPALDPALVAAAKETHTGSGMKVFVRTKGKLPVEGKYTGIADSHQPLSLVTTYAKADDHTLFACFGSDPDKLDVQDRDAVQQVFESFFPGIEVTECYSYEWTLDPYSRGTYCSYRPNWLGKYYDHFQQDRGRVIFGQGDHGEGWRGFIDGAISAGGKAAKRTQTLLG